MACHAPLRRHNASVCGCAMWCALQAHPSTAWLQVAATWQTCRPAGTCGSSSRACQRPFLVPLSSNRYEQRTCCLEGPPAAHGRGPSPGLQALEHQRSSASSRQAAELGWPLSRPVDRPLPILHHARSTGRIGTPPPRWTRPRATRCGRPPRTPSTRTSEWRPSARSAAPLRRQSMHGTSRVARLCSVHPPPAWHGCPGMACPHLPCMWAGCQAGRRTPWCQAAHRVL